MALSVLRVNSLAVHSMAPSGATPRKSARPVQVLASIFLAAATARAADPLVTNVVPGGPAVECLVLPSGATYAVQEGFVLAGDVLLQGSQNTQATLAACAESCTAFGMSCRGFTYCDLRGGCLPVANITVANSSQQPSLASQLMPWGSCELLDPTSLRGTELFARNPGFLLADIFAGVRAVVNTGPLPGYTEFFGTALVLKYDMPCDNSIATAKTMCILQVSLQEAKALCDSMPQCDAFTFSPHGVANISHAIANLMVTIGAVNVSQPTAMANFKTTGTGLINITQGFMTPFLTTYVKEGHLAPLGSPGPPSGITDALPASPPAGDGAVETPDGSSLSTAAIVGIAVGVTVAVAALLAAVLFWRRRLHLQQAQPVTGSRKSMEEAPSGGPQVADDAMELGCCSVGGCPPQLPLQPPQPRGSSTRASASGASAMGSGVPGRSSGLSEGVSSSWQSSSVRLPELFAQAAGLTWKDALVPLEAIKLSRDAEGTLQKLGSGASGEVYHAVLSGTTACACKVFQFDKDLSSPRHFIQEVHMLWRVSHPFLVQFLGAAVDEAEGKGFLLMELMHADLAGCMNLQQPGKGRIYGWHNLGRRVALQVATGLAYLHALSIVHMDVKPSNILLSREGGAKLSDFGFCRTMTRGRISNLSNRLGTFQWCAPEVLLGEGATAKSDIWSLGVIIWELCTGEQPHRGRLRPLATPLDCPPEVAILHHNCMATDPVLRPSAAQVVKVLQRCQKGEDVDMLRAARSLEDPIFLLREQHVLRSVELGSCTFASPLLPYVPLAIQASSASTAGTDGPAPCVLDPAAEVAESPVTVVVPEAADLLSMGPGAAPRWLSDPTDGSGFTHPINPHSPVATQGAFSPQSEGSAQSRGGLMPISGPRDSC